MSDVFATLGEQIASRNWGLSGPDSYVLGVDIGSYGLRAVLTDIRGTHVAHNERELRPDSNADIVIEDVFTLIKELLHKENMRPNHLIRIGVGFGGPVDARQGIIRRSYRMSGWDNLNLRQQFEEMFDASTLIENDASLIAFGEHLFGVGRSTGDLYYLHLSSGVGSGMVLDGRLHRGATTSAGEVGHARTSIGMPTEIEDILSINGLLRRAGELGLQTKDLDTLFGDPNNGKQAIDEAVQKLALGLSGVIQLLDPALIVLGGIVTRKGGESFVRAIDHQVNALISQTPPRHVPVVASSLGPDAVAIGGLALALESLNQ